MPCCATTVSRWASATTWAATERAVAGLASASLRGQIPASRLRQAHGEHHHHHVAGRGADADGRAQRQAQPVAEHARSEEHTSELQSPDHLVCRLLLEKKKKKKSDSTTRCVTALMTKEIQGS